MRKRTLARACALKILYEIDITGNPYEVCVENFWQNQKPVENQIKEFAESLVRGTRENISAIDEQISRHATNWQIKRMAVIDRNVLRLATYELLFLKDIPPKVSINEAVDLAKMFGDTESGKFVNGVLDNIRIERQKV